MVDQEEIHNQSFSDYPRKRTHALDLLKTNFTYMPDKEQAWNDLHRLTNDEDSDVRSNAVDALVSSFSHILYKNKEQAWNDLHRLTSDEDSDVRSKATQSLGSMFSQVPDKQKAWNDLHRLTNDEDRYVRSRAAQALGSAFSQVPNKEQAWNDLIGLTNDEDHYVRSKATDALVSSFTQVLDKQQAWNDLIRLTNDEDSDVRSSAAYALGSAFSQVPDKQKAWNDLIRLTDDEECYVRSSAAYALVSVLSQMPDKQQIWNDLHRLNNHKDYYVRSRAVDALRSNAFVFESFQPSNRREAKNDSTRLIDNEYKISSVSQLVDQEKIHKQCFSDYPKARIDALERLNNFFSYMPDKEQAWNDLIRLTNDEHSDVRYSAAYALDSAYSHVPNKEQAWNDLIRLTNDEDSYVRSSAAYALGSAFSQILDKDKERAWNGLHRLTNDKSSYVRNSAASALGFAFSHVSNKEQAWNDLHRLTNDEENYVRSSAAYALGSAFSHVSNKEQAWNDLIELTNDENSGVRTSSNHSLGRVSIFKASQTETEENYKKELEKAIEFFEIAAKEASYFNPAQFCLPFYRSFHTIIFKRQEAKEEVNKYLEQAKAAIKDSEGKKQLFEAVENLAEALKEVQNIENLDLFGMKDELNFYRKYCDRAAELMKNANEKAPFATEVLRKGLPILDRNLKDLIEEIKAKAETACQLSQGTANKEIACTVNKEIQKWEIGSPEEMAFNVENLIFTLESSIPRIPENQYIFNRIQQVREQKDVAKQYGIISTIIPLIPRLYMEQTVDGLKNDIKEIKDKVDYVIISLKPGITQEIEISSGIEILGTGAALITTIPLQEISYAELKEDMQTIKGEHITKLSELPKRLANKIKGYLLLKDREDIVEQLT